MIIFAKKAKISCTLVKNELVHFILLPVCIIFAPHFNEHI